MSLQLINRVLELTNEERAKAGLDPLELNSELANAAESHSDSMAEDDFFSHTGADGYSVGDRVQSNGYQYSTVGENIAAGYTTAEDVVQAWMDSPGHRDNILNADYTEIGIGYEFLENDTGAIDYNHYWTQVFGTSLEESIEDLEASDPVEKNSQLNSNNVEPNSFGGESIKVEDSLKTTNWELDNSAELEDTNSDYVTGNYSDSVLTGGSDLDFANVNESAQVSDNSNSNSPQFYNLMADSWLGSWIEDTNNNYEEIGGIDADYSSIDGRENSMYEYHFDDF